MVHFPCQFFEFEIKGLDNGGATTLTIYLPEGVSYDTYWKYKPTQDDSQPHWYEFMFDGETGGAEISSGVITLHFVDGRRGDDDLIANGIIVDQGVPGAKITSIPALDTWGILILFAFMTRSGFYVLRRRRFVG
jgi:hypothetical protein